MKRSRKTSNIVLAICAVIAVIFTIAMIILFYLFQSVPDSLIVAVFGAIFGETSALALIKTTKVKHGGEDE